MSQLESLKTIAALGFLSDNIQDRVDKFGSLGVVSLSPVVTSSRLSYNSKLQLITGTITTSNHLIGNNSLKKLKTEELTENEVIGSEDLSERSGSD